MEAFYIGLGAFLSVFIFFIGYATVGVFSVKKQIQETTRILEGLDYRVSDSDRIIHELLNREIETLRRELYNTDQDIRSKIDSRLEGLDYRLSDSDRTIHEVLNREIETLRRELYDTDQDIRSKMDSRLDKLENKLSTNK